MVRFLSLAASILPATMAQSSASDVLAAAKLAINSESYLSKYQNEPMLVKMNEMWVSQAEALFTEKGFLPNSLLHSLAKMAGNSTGNRANTLTLDPLCEDGNCQVPFVLEEIWGYGCWCNFGANLMMGHGAPVNSYDAICKDAQLCLRCAKNDGKDGGYDCDPITKKFNNVNGPGFVSECTNANADDDCAGHVCSCETQLIADLLETVFQPHAEREEFDPSVKHSEGFDYEAECPKATGPQYEAECCGLYPRRFPFGSGNPNKACCAGINIYNPVYQECCNDGTAADTGACTV